MWYGLRVPTAITPLVAAVWQMPTRARGIREGMPRARRRTCERALWGATACDDPATDDVVGALENRGLMAAIRPDGKHQPVIGRDL